MIKPSEVILLVEDGHQQRLIYKHLLKCGFTRHDIRQVPFLPGQGSAESWVRREFVEQTNAYRNRQARAETGLIVMIDADKYTVRERWNQLDQVLKDRGKRTVGRRERIVRLVPKHNVETWILCLNEEPVDEETDYKGTSHEWNELILTASETLCQWTRLNTEPPNRCVKSRERYVKHRCYSGAGAGGWPGVVDFC
jgi:hypothetical protein